MLLSSLVVCLLTDISPESLVVYLWTDSAPE